MPNCDNCYCPEVKGGIRKPGGQAAEVYAADSTWLRPDHNNLRPRGGSIRICPDTVSSVEYHAGHTNLTFIDGSTLTVNKTPGELRETFARNGCQDYALGKFGSGPPIPRCENCGGTPEPFSFNKLRHYITGGYGRRPYVDQVLCGSCGDNLNGPSPVAVSGSRYNQPAGFIRDRNPPR